MTFWLHITFNIGRIYQLLKIHFTLTSLGIESFIQITQKPYVNLINFLNLCSDVLWLPQIHKTERLKKWVSLQKVDLYI